MLSRPQGATITAIMKVTGWRCAASSQAWLRKKLGLRLVPEKVGDERVYRIVAPDAQRPVKTKPTRRAA
jgi:hypothetical protein